MNRFCGLAAIPLQELATAVSQGFHAVPPATIWHRAVPETGGLSEPVLSLVPHLGTGTNWRSLAKPYRNCIVHDVEDRCLQSHSKHVAVEHLITPLQLHQTLNPYLSCALSLEPILTQSTCFRHHSQSVVPPKGISLAQVPTVCLTIRCALISPHC